jgi:hypothetical protein
MSADPIALFEETTRRFNAEDWDGVADLCDAASLSAFRRDLLERYTSAPRVTAPFTPEDYLKHYPDMPREVAEYNAKQHQQRGEPLRRLREDMPRINSLEELQALNARGLYAAWLQNQSPRVQIEKQLAAGLASPQAAERALAQIGDFYSYRPIGMVMDGERISHVLYQGGPPPESWTTYEAMLVESGIPEDQRQLRLDLYGHEYPSIFTCRRGPDGEWRLLADHNLSSMGSVVFIANDDDELTEVS